MVEACIRIALGEKPDINRKWNKGSAIRYFHQHSGVVKSIEGIEEAEKIPGIVQVSIVHDVGEEITEINNRLTVKAQQLKPMIDFIITHHLCATISFVVRNGKRQIPACSTTFSCREVLPSWSVGITPIC